MVTRTTAIALALAASTGAHAAALDADTMRNFGGRYAVDCAAPAGVVLRVEPDALVLDVRGRTITGAKVQASYSYFGQSPPPGFAVALQSELRDGKELVFLVHQGASGQRIELQADPKLMAALGAMATQKYRDCDEDAQQARRRGGARRATPGGRGSRRGRARHERPAQPPAPEAGLPARARASARACPGWPSWRGRGPSASAFASTASSTPRSRRASRTTATTTVRWCSSRSRTAPSTARSWTGRRRS